MSTKVMIIAAHPDDEAIGCAGTIARHIDMGDIVSVVFMTNGVSSRINSNNAEEITERKKAAIEAAQMLGTKKPVFLDYPDNRMDSVDILDIVKSIEEVIFKERVEIIYTHFSGDLNIDHHLTHKAVLTACRPQSSSTVKEIYCFEILSSTEWNSVISSHFIPNVFVNISDYWDRKIQVLECYEKELRDSPHSRSYKCLNALSLYRGETNGFNYAEAFVLERMLVR